MTCWRCGTGSAGGPLVPGRPTCIIAHTHKGQGVSFMADRVEWHHRVPTDDELARALAEIDASVLERGVFVSALFDCRAAFADALVALAERDPRIVAVVNDSVGSSHLISRSSAPGSPSG